MTTIKFPSHWLDSSPVDEERLEQGKYLNCLSLGALIAAHAKHQSKWPKRIAAEVTFCLATAMKASSDSMGEGFRDAKDDFTEQARRYAEECVRLAATLPSETLPDVCPNYTSLVGVPIPNYFYLDYVRRILQDRGLLG